MKVNNKFGRPEAPGPTGKILYSNSFPHLLIPDEDGEVFQVRKSSHSKKVMKMMDKERRKKKHTTSDAADPAASSARGRQRSPASRQRSRTPPPPPTFAPQAAGTDDGTDKDDKVLVQNSVKRSHDNSNSIQTEIRTDDFVVRLLLSIFCKYLLDTLTQTPNPYTAKITEKETLEKGTRKLAIPLAIV